MKLLLAGATGTLGAPLLAELARRGHQVRALTRRAGTAAPGVAEVAVGDLGAPETLEAACEGVEAVVSAVGASLALGVKPGSPTYREVDDAGNRRLLRAAQAAGVRKFVYVSVHHGPALAGLDYVRAHADFAEALRASGLAYTVVHPTGFFSAFDLFIPLARRGLMPLLGTGEALSNPIHEADLARVCADALEGAQTEVPAGGPDVISRRAVAELAFEAVGKRPRFVRVPDAVVGFNRRLVGLVDPRLGQLLAFLQAVNHTDVVAPALGTRRLGDYFQEVAAR